MFEIYCSGIHYLRLYGMNPTSLLRKEFRVQGGFPHSVDLFNRTDEGQKINSAAPARYLVGHRQTHKRSACVEGLRSVNGALVVSESIGCPVTAASLATMVCPSITRRLKLNVLITLRGVLRCV